MSASTQFDIPEVLEYYNVGSNIQVMEGDNNSEKCYIFFSSHGIYYPNTLETFRQRIIFEDRYEWKKNIPGEFARLIFVRDIQKQWYICGINGEISTVRELEAYLKKLTDKKKVICVGSSAGGFAATLFGCLLNASYVFSFSGQFSLSYILEDPSLQHTNQTLYRYGQRSGYSEFYDVRNLLRESHSTRILYCYPSGSADDFSQAKIVKGFENVYAIGLISNTHGIPFPVECLGYLLNMDERRLLKIYSRFNHQEIRPALFALAAMGIAGFSKLFLKRKILGNALKLKMRIRFNFLTAKREF